MQGFSRSPNYFKYLIIIVLVLGIFFRLTNLERKFYWYDETFTSLRVSGYLESELLRHLANAKAISVEDFQKYQHPNLEKGLVDTVKSLAVEDAQHPPFYYAIAKFWMQVFGSSITAMRSLPALLSLLAFPCIYWLCLELFESTSIAWVAVALIAVSPFHVLYAQEAREYSLWTVTTLLSSAALLRAMRLKTRISWGIYSLTLIINLYTFLFSILLFIGHTIYVATIEKFRLNKTLRDYILASFLGLLGFLPWILIVITNLSKINRATAWLATETPKRDLLRKWLINHVRIFLDLNYTLSGGLKNLLPTAISLLFISAVIVYSLYLLCRKTSEQVWLFIFILIGVTELALIVPDLFFGGIRANIPRYFIPSYLGIQLAVAYLLGTKLTSVSVNIWKQKLWQLVTIALVSCGVLSCVISSQAELWWNKANNADLPGIARIINQSTRPLLIANADIGDLLSLSYLLNPTKQPQIKTPCYYNCPKNSQWRVKPYIPKIPESSKDVFLFNPRPSYQWLNELAKESTYKIEPVSQSYGSYLWKLININKSDI